MGLAVASYKPPTYGGYEYPYFAVIIGWCIALSSVVPIPVTFVMQILDERGSLAQVCCLYIHSWLAYTEQQ